jgi:diguanylate cyclase (GGDEF)-like protein/PAS domain S-box-containing protein
LFNRFDQSVIRANFDIEVFEEVVNRATVLHDGDGTAQRLQTAPALPLLHRHELEFTGVKWLLYFNQKHAPGIQDMLLAQGGTLGAGILLSLLAAYIAVRVRRHYKALAQEAWQAEKFAVFFEHHPFAVYSLNRQRRFTAVNAQTEKELGVSRDRLLGMSVDQFVIAQHIDNSHAYFQQALQGAAVSYHNMVRSADGTQSNLSVVLVPISVDGKVSSVLGIAKNVTEKKRAELELYRSRQTLQIVLDTIPQLVFWKSVDGVYQGGNRRMLEFAGIRHLDDLIGKTDAQMPWRRYAAAYSVQDRTVVQTGNPLVNHQETQVQPDGTELWIEVNKVPMPGPDGTIDYVLGVVEDITARKKAENELFRRANYDDLTGAATRAYFYLQLDRVLAQHARHARPAALMYFDIDRFKQINDTHGHGVGDRVIQEFVNRISQVLRSSDLLARLGGDEFVLLVEDAQSDGGLRVLAERVIGLMQEPFVINDKTLHVRTSIGIAVYQPGLTADQWVTQADQALYKAKDSGRNRYHFSKSGSE